MLVKSFPNYAGGGKTLLTGTPCLLAVLRKVSSLDSYLLLVCHFCAVFLPLPPALVQGQVSIGW